MLVKGLTDTKSYYNFVNHLAKVGRGKADTQVEGSIGFYKNPLFEQLLTDLLPEIERHTGYQLYKTYSYGRVYHLGEELAAHKDRKACEITVSLCLGTEDRTWPIWIHDRENKDHAIEIEPGDALIFKGVELKHWREPNTFGDCVYAFLHYVDQNGPYADQKDDLGDKPPSY